MISATARSAYEKAIALDPGVANAHFNYGKLLMKAFGDFAATCGAYEKAIEINAGLAGAYLNYSTAFRKLDRDSEANNAYEKAIQLSPSLRNAAGQNFVT